MITTPVRDDIRAFAAAVRSHLDDLPSDEVDDLLDGLEADLSDQADEAGDAFEIPDATTYAAELRTAAGLPERPPVTDAGPPKPLGARITARWDAALSAVRSTPAGAWTLDLLSSLRPVWWLVRGVVIFVIVVPIIRFARPTSFDEIDRLLAAATIPGALLLFVILLLSVQWGRGRWASRRWLRVTRGIVNGIAIVVVPFLAMALLSGAVNVMRSSSIYGEPRPDIPSGLAIDGQRVRNIYAYDATGAPITSVQLFDQDGRALTTVGPLSGAGVWDPYFAGGGGPVPVGYTVPGSTTVWNVFPLREIPPEKLTWDAAEDLAAAKTPGFPFARVQPIPVSDTTGASPSAAPVASTTPAVTPSPAPAP